MIHDDTPRSSSGPFRLRFSPWGFRLFLFWVLATAFGVLGFAFKPAALSRAEAAEQGVLVAKAGSHDAGREPFVTAPPTWIPSSIYKRVLDKGDSWTAMRFALDELETHPGQPLYQTVFARGPKFQYPPTSLLSLDALKVAFGPTMVANWFQNLVGLALLPLMLVSVYLLARPGLPRLRDAALDHALPFLFTVTCYPLFKAIELGQIQSHLNTLFCVAALLYARGRPLAAGVVLGVMSTIKPQLGLFLLWAIVQGERSMAIAMGATALSIGLISVARYGLAPHLEYLHVLSEISKHGESYYANQSLNGLLLRALHLGPNLKFTSLEFAPYSPWVRYPTQFASFALIALGVWRSPLWSKSREVNFALAALCFTAGSPVAWEHHYGIVPGLFALAFPTLMANTYPRALWVCVGASWILLSSRIRAVGLTAPTAFNFLQSYSYFGALLFIFVLQWLRSSQKSQVTTLKPFENEIEKA
jgi:hypothetical protein